MPLLLDGKSDKLLHPTQEKSSETQGRFLTVNVPNQVGQLSVLHCPQIPHSP